MAQARAAQRCRDCHRELRTPESRRRGYGPVCWDARRPPLFDEPRRSRPRSLKVEQLELDVFTVDGADE